MAVLTARRIAAHALLAALAAAAARAEPVIVVHPSCPVSTLDAEHARRLLLGEELAWSNGEAVQLVESRGEDAVAAAAYLKIAHKTPSQIRAEWNRLVFSGRANPPLRFATPLEVRAAVARLPGAFAVIDSTVADRSVKIVYRAPGNG